MGKIYPIEASISAPFSRKECAVVSYDIYQQYWKKSGTQGGNTVAEPISYEGYHMAPSEIHTGIERVKILGFPELADVPEQETTGYGRIETFIEQTNFTQAKGNFIKGVNELAKVIPLDESGAAAVNFELGQPVPDQMLKSREQAITKGEDVCLIGIFNSTRRGIIPDNRLWGRTMKLIPGTKDQILSKLTKDSGIVIAFGFIIAALCISVGLLPYAPDSLLNRVPAGDKFIQYRNSVLPRQNKMSGKIIPEREQTVRNSYRRNAKESN